MKRYFYLVFVFLLIFANAYGWRKKEAADKPAEDQWAMDAKVGDYTDTFDEAALMKLQSRGEVSIYLIPPCFNRPTLKKSIRIKVNGYDIDSAEIITKVIAEQSAGNCEADIIF